MTGWRSLTAENRPSRVSRRSLALRLSLSGPWQAKQLSERMGRISRLKRMVWGRESGLSPAWAGTDAASTDQIRNSARRCFIQYIPRFDGDYGEGIHSGKA